MPSRASIQLMTILCVLVMPLTAVPGFSQDWSYDTYSARGTLSLNRSMPARAVTKRLLRILLDDFSGRDFDTTLSTLARMRVSNRGTARKGVPILVNWNLKDPITGVPYCQGVIRRRTNRDGVMNAVFNNPAGRGCVFGPTTEQIVVEVQFDLIGGKFVDLVKFDLQTGPVGGVCVRDSEHACLEDGTTVSIYRMQGARRRTIPHVASSAQAARFEDSQGNIQFKQFDLCSDPNYNSHQFQFIGNYPGKWVAVVSQVGTPWRTTVIKPRTATVVNLFDAPCGPFR